MATLNWRNEIRLLLLTWVLLLLSTPVLAQSNGNPSHSGSGESLAGAQIKYKVEIEYGERLSRTLDAELRGSSGLYRVEFEIPRLSGSAKQNGEADGDGAEASGGSEENRDSDPGSSSEETNSGKTEKNQRFWMVVDREAGELTLVFPPTKLAQTIELEALDPEKTPPALGFFAQGKQWLERFRSALAALEGNESGSSEESGAGTENGGGSERGADGLSEELTIEQLDSASVAGAAGEGYRIAAPETAGLEVVFSREWGFPLRLSASSRESSQRAALTAHSVTQSTFSRSELTAVPEDFQSLRAEKVADLVLIHLFEKLASSPRSARRLSVSNGDSEEQSE